MNEIKPQQKTAPKKKPMMSVSIWGFGQKLSINVSVAA